MALSSRKLSESAGGWPLAQTGQRYGDAGPGCGYAAAARLVALRR
jgi:hypothetical protein